MSNNTKSRIVTQIEVAQIPDSECGRYAERFLTPHTVISNKKIYVYPEVHAALSRMVKSMCAPGVSIGSYASEIILDHIAKHHTVMQGIYTKNIKDLF